MISFPTPRSKPKLLAQPTQATTGLVLLFLLDGELIARRLLVLVADRVSDELVLGLLSGALVILGALLEDCLLDPIDTYSNNQERKGHTV